MVGTSRILFVSDNLYVFFGCFSFGRDARPAVNASRGFDVEECVIFRWSVSLVEGVNRQLVLKIWGV